MPSTGQGLHHGIVRKLDVARLRFDTENPRLPRTVDSTDDEAVLGYMLRDATLTDLMASIAENGYFEGEPVLVAPLPGQPLDLQNGIFRVVEGNRRLAAVRLLNDPTSAPARRQTVQEIVLEAKHIPNGLPVIVYSDRAEVLDYLGYRHITGVDAWDSLAKARYLRQLLGVPPKTRPAQDKRLHILARKIGSYNRIDYVARLLNGLTLYDYADEHHFFSIVDLTEDDVDFSLLTTALSYRGILDFLDVGEGKTRLFDESFNAQNFRYLFSWLYQQLPSGGRVVGESRQLRELAAVVAEPAALAMLIAGASLAEAVIQTGEPLVVFRKSLQTARQNLDAALRNAAVLERTEPEDLDSAAEVRNVARTLFSVVQERQQDDDSS